MKRPRDKGSRGEREVVAMFRVNGYPRAARSPGSGSMRPYGAGDLSPWPGDLCFVEPWMVEVKFDQRVEAGGLRTWPGSTFLRATLRDLDKLWDRHAGIIGGVTPLPVLFARANLHPWRVFVSDTDFLRYTTGAVRWRGAWVELTVDQFFELDERRLDEAGDVLPPPGVAAT